jgi:hypothetical protein
MPVRISADVSCGRWAQICRRISTGRSRPGSPDSGVAGTSSRCNRTKEKPDGVVERADPVEFGLQFAGVFDLLQVGVLGFDVAEQALDPGLVVGVAGRPKWVAMRAAAKAATGEPAATLRS